jgi:hypothetical protein
VTPTLTRRCAVLLLATVTPVLVAVPAGAEVPEGWSEPEDVGILEMLVLVAGIPLVLALLISLAVLVPALARGEKLLPSSETPDRWFGGPRESAGELESGREVGPTGGASGRW